MARTSIPWRLLPARELGCGSPATCWRRLTEWAKTGVFEQLHLEILDRLGLAARLQDLVAALTLWWRSLTRALICLKSLNQTKG